MTELDEFSSHFQVIDANPTKGVMNKCMIKAKKCKECYISKLYYLNFKTS